MKYIFEKLILGFVLSATFGPVTLEMIKRGLNRGFWSAFNLRVGAALGNFLCLSVSWKSLSCIVNSTTTLSVLSSIGSALLFHMGLITLIKKNTLPLARVSKNYSNGIILGFYLSIFNPVGLIFWSGIFAANLSKNEGFWLNSVIILGVLLWGGLLSLILAFSQRIFNKIFIIAVTKISGLFMIMYSVKYAYNAWF